MIHVMANGLSYKDAIEANIRAGGAVSARAIIIGAALAADLPSTPNTAWKVKILALLQIEHL